MKQSIKNQSQLKFQFLSNGNIHSIRFEDLFVNLYLGNEMEPNINNLFLRIHTKDGLVLYPLFGSNTNSQFQIIDSFYLSQGKIHGLDCNLSLELHPNLPAWRYKIQITNNNKETLDYDLVYVQDIGICDYGAARLNEFFVCHYIHHEPIDTKEYGYGILSRQNETIAGKNPASFLFSTSPISSFVTDGLDLYPDGIRKKLPAKRRQGEHSIIGLERLKTRLLPGESEETCFYGYLFADLKTLSSFPEVQTLIQKIRMGWNESPNWGTENLQSSQSLFSSAKRIEGETATESDLKTLFPNEWREVEFSPSGKILSFFTDESTHVVSKEKEALCLRPHGQILRTGVPKVPEESSLTGTCYFNGIFLSQLTEGHTSINQYLSRNHSYLNFFHSYGFRIFIEEDSGFALLDTPSFLRMEPNQMEWIYLLEKEILRIQVEATNDHQFLIQMATNNTQAKQIFLSFHIALDGDNGTLELPPVITKNKTNIYIQPNPNSPLFQRLEGKGFRICGEDLSDWKVSDDSLLFLDGKSRGQSYLTAKIQVHSNLQFSIQGDMTPSLKPKTKKDNLTHIFSLTKNLPIGKIKNQELEVFHQIKEILPWFEQNAHIHYLNPRGLEQYSGGGWGTRDVCQGAFEYLLATGDFESCRTLLLTVFEEQNEDGDWPQWFMLYPRDKTIRAGDSHGDIVYWPILALSTYLERTGDLSFLDLKTNGIHRKEQKKILDAVEKTISLINKRLVANTNLPIYGNGDWNDSLQPVKENFRTHAVSTWTAELQSLTYQALIQIYQQTDDREKVEFYQRELETIKQNIKEHCMAEETLTGLRYFDGTDSQKFFLHPSDTKTGIRYSILPMIYGILAEVLDPKEAEFHLTLIKNFLTGPDGVRLFDAPILYSDGNNLEFKRAETASYFGREIGLMYTHAHLRYCEALAYMGKSEDFFHNLNLVNPIGIQKKVPASNHRQSNCYYSSSDGLFFDRYEAKEKYKDLLAGKIPLEGGWRVYSSGPGIYIKLVYECLFGIRVFFDALEIDPILPKGLDGFEWDVRFLEKDLKIIYRVESENASIESVDMNGKPIAFQREANRYRRGCIRVKFRDLELNLKNDHNQLILTLR
ncbi:GH36-type glycosyl hydrolase domain-containing protein [Leptospira mtsangambouensis]|nr:amylo-alpha-1,6-glucosidase [Leptospira mtsangambouensis]